ncbi:MAG: hypothetical protein QXY40_01925 [Candidatus Methanomethylicia archaeon]
MAHIRIFKIILVFSILINIILVYQLFTIYRSTDWCFKRDVALLHDEALRACSMTRSVLNNLRSGDNITALYEIGILEVSLENLHRLYEDLHYRYGIGDDKLIDIADKFDIISMTVILAIREKIVKNELSNGEVRLLEKIMKTIPRAYNSIVFHLKLPAGLIAEDLNYPISADYIPPTIDEVLEELSSIRMEAYQLGLG